MGFEFGSAEWADAFHTQLVKDDRFADATAEWEGDFYFVTDADDAGSGERIVYVDVWHGDIRAVAAVSSRDEYRPEYVLSGPLNVWKRVLQHDVSPLTAIMMRQLKLEGNMLKIMSNSQAALAMVQCAAAVDTFWPGDGR